MPLTPTQHQIAEAIRLAYPRKTAPVEDRRCIWKAVVSIAKRIKAKEAGLEMEPRTLRNYQDRASAWLLARVEMYADSPWVAMKEPSFIPMCSTWMNQGRYEATRADWGYPTRQPTKPTTGPVLRYDLPAKTADEPPPLTGEERKAALAKFREVIGYRKTPEAS